MRYSVGGSESAAGELAGPHPVTNPARIYVPTAPPAAPVCSPGNWRLVKGVEYISPRRRSYGRIAASDGWTRFSG